MTDPTADDTGFLSTNAGDFDGDPADLKLDASEELSARARTQRRLSQARSAVSDASLRARRSAALPTRQTAATTEDGAPSAAGTVADHVQAYRTYILGAAAALLALIAVVRRRRSSTPDTADTVDLGVWHLRADPPTDQA